MNRRELIQALLAAPVLLRMPSAGAVDATWRLTPPGRWLWCSGLRETMTYNAGEFPRYSYAYDVDFAAEIGEGPLQHGVRRIWADHWCVYDKRPGQPAEVVALTDEIERRLTVYPGTETQGASPLIESYLGKGQAPTFRGLAYATLEELPLEPYGNRVPVLRFEAA